MRKTTALHTPKPQYRLTAKFGDLILDAGHTAIPNLLLEHYTALGITPQQMLFIIHIIQFKWDPRDPYPGMQTIARRMGMSVRQMQRYEQELIRKGCLVVTARHSADGKQLTNEYNFTRLMEQVLAIRQSQTAHTRAADAAGAAQTGAMGAEDASLPPTLTPMSPSPLTALSPKEDTAQTDTSPDRPEKNRGEQKEAKKEAKGWNSVDARHEWQTSTPSGAPRTARHPVLATPSATDTSSHPRPSRRDEGLRSIRDFLPEASDDQRRFPHDRPHTPASTPATEVMHEAPMPLTDANALPATHPSHVTTPSAQAAFQPSTASAQIAQLAEDLCREFGDPKLNSTTRQIQTLYQASGLSESGFIDWLLVVRSHVRGSRNKIKRPMGYFMTLLKNTLRRNGLLPSAV